MKKTINEGVNILTRKTVDGWKSSIEEASIMRDQLVSLAVEALELDDLPRIKRTCTFISTNFAKESM